MKKYRASGGYLDRIDEMKEKAARSNKKRKRPSRSKQGSASKWLNRVRFPRSNDGKLLSDGRSTNAANRDRANGSLYFYHPDGKGLRSTSEIEQYQRRKCLIIQKWWKRSKLKKYRSSTQHQARNKFWSSIGGEWEIKRCEEGAKARGMWYYEKWGFVGNANLVSRSIIGRFRSLASSVEK